MTTIHRWACRAALFLLLHPTHFSLAQWLTDPANNLIAGSGLNPGSSNSSGGNYFTDAQHTVYPRNLDITVTRMVSWDALMPEMTYISIADGFGSIRPYNINLGETFKAGRLLISGQPNASIVLTFVLPGTLFGTFSGNVVVAYGDSSIGVTDSGSSIVHLFHDPHLPLSIVLDSAGLRQIYVAGDVFVSVDATEGDTFINWGIIFAAYTDSALIDSLNGVGVQASAEIEFDVTPAMIEGSLSINPRFPAIRWSAMRSGVSYSCNVDPLADIHPVEPDNPEGFSPCFLTITGSAGAQCEFRFVLPTQLTSRIGSGRINLRYDSLSAGLDTGRGEYRWFDPRTTTRFVLDRTGSAFLVLIASPQVSADVKEGDTLTGVGAAQIEYTRLDKRRLPQGASQYNSREILFEATIASSIALLQNYPNPFNPATRIDYWIPHAVHVRLAVYDLLGREVALLVDQVMPEGTQSVLWDGTNHPSGVYFYRLEAGKSHKTNKLVIMR